MTNSSSALSLAPSPASSLAPSPAPTPPPVQHNVFLQMWPIALAVFVGFLTIGLPLPVLPLHLHYTLGMSPVVVGVAIGALRAAGIGEAAGPGPR